MIQLTHEAFSTKIHFPYKLTEQMFNDLVRSVAETASRVYQKGNAATETKAVKTTPTLKVTKQNVAPEVKEVTSYESESKDGDE